MSFRCTIFSSSELPITLTRTEDADSVYNELLKTKAFVVPENNSDRLKHWPALGSKEMEVTGVGKNESIVDIVLSSAGNFSLTNKFTFAHFCDLVVIVLQSLQDGSRSLLKKPNVSY